MSRTLVFALIAVAGVLAAAAALRARDSPYLAYADGKYAGALDGLRRKAETGDGFAAYLVGNVHRDGLVGPRDPRAATGWYIVAARAGEIRAVRAYIDVVAHESPQPTTCQAAVSLLDLAARAGEPGALVTLGRYFEAGFCVEPNPARALGYYLAAERFDRRLGDLKVQVVAKIEASGNTIDPIPPEKSDITVGEVLTRFLAEAPRLPSEING